MFLLIAIAVWACALVIWWICSNAFRHSDLDKLKSRLIGTSKTKAAKVAVGGGGVLCGGVEDLVLLADDRQRALVVALKATAVGNHACHGV